MVNYIKKLFGNNTTGVNSMEGEDTNFDTPIELDDSYASSNGVGFLSQFCDL